MTAHQPIPLFRPEVIDARKDRLHGDISLAVPLSWQVIGFLLFAALAAALGFLALGTYSQVETVPGEIVLDKGTAAIVASRPGVVDQLAVRDGQHVAAGGLLARIRSEEDLTGGGTAPQHALDSLAQQRAQLKAQAALVLNAASADRARLQDTVRGAEQEIEALDQQMADQQRLVTLAENDLAASQTIADRGFISRRDLDDRKATLLSRRQQLAQLRQARTEKLTSISDAQRSMTESLATAQAQAVAVQSQRAQLEQQVAQFQEAKGYALTSPIAGAVTALTARLGQPAAQGQQLMVIVPDGGRARVQLYVPTSSAGFLAKGQQVRLAIDAFPYQTFGTVEAHLTDISSTVVARQTANGTVPVYLVTAELARPSVRAFGKTQPLMPGMTVSARIVTRRQSLFEWLFEPLFAVSRR